jgi:predicted phosphohydrolase
MRLVAVADTHLFHNELSIPDGDVFIHAGDMCRAGDLTELAEAAQWIQSLPHRHKIVVAGNHDWAFAKTPEAARALFSSDVLYLQDSAVQIAGLTFWGSPWQPAYNDWAFNLPRGEPLAERWSRIPIGTDVLITHGPPAGIGDGSSNANRKGCGDLLERVRIVRPRIHLFGHIHEDGGAWNIDGTFFVNCTTWECEQGATVIEIEGRNVRVTPT